MKTAILKTTAGSTTIDTPVGPLTLVMRGGAVLAAGFTDDESLLWPQVHPSLRGEAGGDPEPVIRAVTEYFAGDLGVLDAVPVTQPSTGEFLAPAWRTLREIKPGAPVSYTEYARLCGRPAAIRAAAQACARNAVALFIPCHRVVRTDGSLGGYRWGLEVKRYLLTHEETRS